MTGIVTQTDFSETMDALNKDIKAFAESMRFTQGELRDIVVVIAQELIVRVIEKTPVLTGQARGGWSSAFRKLSSYSVAGIRGGATKVEPRLGSSPFTDKQGNNFEFTNKDIYRKRNRKTKKLEALDFRGGIEVRFDNNVAHIKMWNDVPYIRVLEFEGHSKQAPAGMVAVSIMEIRGVYRAKIEEYLKRTFNKQIGSSAKKRKRFPKRPGGFSTTRIT